MDYLPSYPTPLVGRQDELAHIQALLANPACRLLTLVGPGGVGKTRLATEVARLRSPKFVNGAYFVALQPLDTSDLIIPAIAEAIHFQFYSGDEPKLQLINYLRDKSMLLVLDNLEHLLGGVELLIDIVKACSDVKLLITSRERLNALEEWVFVLDGLRVPDEQATDALDNYGAVQLFVQRARQLQSTFTLNDNAECVSAICRRVEGLPLGLELAAAWLRAMSCCQIAHQLTDLDLLETQLRNTPQRHRSLRAVFEHSWRLLSSEERVVLSKIAIFRGGFTSEAAAQIAGASRNRLATLIDKSLVRLSAGRYDLHQLVRQFAEEHLTPDERKQTLEAHSVWYLGRVSQAESIIRDGEYSVIVPELDNLRAAWFHAVQLRNWDLIRTSCNSISHLYALQSRFAEGADIFQGAIQNLDETVADQRHLLGNLLLLSGYFLYFVDHSENVIAAIQQGFSLLEPYESRPETGTPLFLAALTLFNLSADFSLVERTARRGLAISQRYDDRRGTSLCLNLLGVLALCRGQLAHANELVSEAHRINQQHKYPIGLGWSIQTLADLAYASGQYDDARRRYELSIQVHQAVSYHTHIEYDFRSLGQAALNQHEDEAANDYFDKALAFATKYSPPTISVITAWRGIAAALTGNQQIAKTYFDELLSHLEMQDNFSAAHLGWLDYGMFALTCGRYEDALRFAEGVLTIVHPQDFRLVCVQANTVIAHALLGLGKFEQARLILREILNEALAMRLYPATLDILTGIAQLSIVPSEQAAELLAFVCAHPAASRFSRNEANRLLSSLPDNLDRQTFQDAVRRGQRQDLVQVVEPLDALLARSEIRQSLPNVSARRASLDPLSARELEVLRLIADGLSNREIAAQLILGMSTVKWYVSQILGKLHVSNRTQAVAHARRQGLIP